MIEENNDIAENEQTVSSVAEETSVVAEPVSIEEVTPVEIVPNPEEVVPTKAGPLPSSTQGEAQEAITEPTIIIESKPIAPEVGVSTETESISQVPQESVADVAHEISEKSVPVVENEQLNIKNSDPSVPVKQEEVPQAPQVDPPQLPVQPVQQTVIEKIIYKPTKEMMQKLLVLARAETQRRKRKKLDKIMKLFETKQKITNRDVQKLLIVSSYTVVRYMNILEQENKVKQEGRTGHSVFYTKIR